MRISRLHRRITAAALTIFAIIATNQAASNQASAFEPDSVEFFENRIRPVLVAKCYQCHSEDAEQTGGSLWLDSADSMRNGGDSGPAIHPGDADASVLVSAIRYQSSEMPPDQPLPPNVVDDFVRWINAGAIDPRKPGGNPAKRPSDEIDLDAGREFWAFRPIRDFRQPNEASDPIETSDLIDGRIGAALRQQGLRPGGPADPETRLRRLAFDLTGLPPSPDIRSRWLAEPSEKTWAAVVDQLLASRAFAQHWARHWMDIARYADSNGSDFNATYHEAWRYRDYLVDSFDSGRPLDEMIRQQIAGDLMPADSDQQRHDNVVATTFLMLAPKMLSERDKPKLILDVVDEQIDTVGRAFLGMTLGCARCHDHKFDPIPTADYYALAGIFKSTQTLNGESQKYVSTFNRVPLPTSDGHRQEIKDHKSRLSELEKQIKTATRELSQAKANNHQGIIVDDVEATQTGTWRKSTYTKGFVGSGYVHDDNANKGKLSIEFRKRLPSPGRYVVRFAFSASGTRAANVNVVVETANGDQTVIVDQTRQPDHKPFQTLGTFEFSDQHDAVVTVSNQGTQGHVIADAIQLIPEQTLHDPQQSGQVDNAIADLQSNLDDLKSELAELKKNAPPPLPEAMAPRDLSPDQITDSPVHIRGEVRNVGQVVPRGFLQVCGSGDASIDSPVGSGRLELAAWLTDPDNPLVARVLVNRIWMHLLGEGIVRTVDNFGTRGELPSHPELLDALAIDLMRGGWQLKPMVRRIVLSDAYNRSSQPSKANAEIDPENRLLWRAHRKRLTAESIRDSMLVASGKLTDQEPTAPVADKGVLVTKNNGDSKAAAADIQTPIRSMYLPLVRGNLSPLLTALDAADPDLLVGKRPTTNVPGQALVLLNSASVGAWAEATAERIFADDDTWPDQVAAAYRECLSREASASDMELANHYGGLAVSDASSREQQLARLTDLIAAIFASTEFRMLD